MTDEQLMEALGDLEVCGLKLKFMREDKVKEIFDAIRKLVQHA